VLYISLFCFVITLLLLRRFFQKYAHFSFRSEYYFFQTIKQSSRPVSINSGRHRQILASGITVFLSCSKTFLVLVLIVSVKQKKKHEVLGRTNRLLSLIYIGHIENNTSNNSSIAACVFVTAVTFLPNRYLATIGGFLPSRCLATIKRFLPSHCLAMIGEFLTSRWLATISGLLPSRCLATMGGYTDTHRQATTWSHKPTFIFFKIRKVG
jgi:hypothetical protein